MAEVSSQGCGAIREQLADLRGAMPRGQVCATTSRCCAGCRAFDAEVRRQRAGMAVLLAVVPSLALKESSLAAAHRRRGEDEALERRRELAAAGQLDLLASEEE